MFSHRVPSNRQANQLTLRLAAARAAGRSLLDLTVSNPTVVGLNYPSSLLSPLASAASLTYCPHAFGLPEARAAVSRDYARRGIRIATERLVLTASTSEAYSLLFKLLCRPQGDAVLVPVPSYPLFDHLTALDGVGARSYQLASDSRWTVDFDTIDRAWASNVRAVLAVSPNNPTGSVLTAAELAELDARCAARDAVLILDEVFADFPIDEAGAGDVGRAGPPATALTFRLGGLSKSAALPQVKLAWIAVDGPAPLVHEALERLELISDTYLSVSTPVQAAAGELLAASAPIRAEILARLRANYGELVRQGRRHPAVEVLPVAGGWSAVVRVPAVRSEEDLVLALLDEDGVVVHPGYFFDFPREAYVVLSLLPEPATFRSGVQMLMRRASA